MPVMAPLRLDQDRRPDPHQSQPLNKPQTRTTRISLFSSPVLMGTPGLSSYSSVIRPGADCVLDQIRDPEVIVLDGAELARLRLEIGLGDEV